ncbi:MAG TPA: adenylosuccinate synthase [Bacteroidales bacterium]|nr:adenylosuccinate synthase [Bacteroidales bacterium]
MNTDVLLGLQWGDEGKGKIVDVLTPNYQIIARFQGGPNAGHTLEFSGKKYVLHTIPSGIFRENVINVIGNGVVIDPIIFKKEIDKLSESGVELISKLKISKKAHLILPSHRILDAASEAAKGKSKIGSTLKGIGPTYMDKTGRNGLRVGDILSANFMEKYKTLVDKHKHMLKQFDFEYNFAEFEAGFFEGIECLKKFDLIESEYYLNHAMVNGKSILAEGAQGTLLDIDFGSYPFVTSSNTITAGASTGLGIAPNRIGEVFGIFKAYCTRVGSGPFPTELFDETGETLRSVGKEFGSTTGRARRCGWLDLAALKYSVMINGVTKLIMMKADVMNNFETIKVAVGYSINAEVTDMLPFELTEEVVPVYKELKGWNTDITGLKSETEFPVELNEYISYIEDYLGVPIWIVSVGPDREATILRNL